MALCGIFIRTARNDGDFRNECLKKLNALSSERSICYINRDDTYGGFKVYFKDSVTVSNILKEKVLRVGEERVPIYPLATALIVHAGPSDFTEDFQNILRNAISHLGTVLEIKNIPFCESFPDLYTGDWKVVLEVPEIEDLKIFTQNGFPDNMILNLPGSKEEYRVAFYCTSCKKEGHTLQRCSKDIAKPLCGTETQSLQISSLSSSKNTEGVPMSSVDSKAALDFQKPNLNDESSIPITQHKRPPSISSKNIASIASKIGEETVRQQLINSGHKEKLFVKNELNRDSVERSSTKRSADHMESGENEEPQGCSYFDGDVMFLEEKTSPKRSSISSSSFLSPFRSNSVDESGQVTTSSLPEGVNDSIKSELPSTDDNDSDTPRAPEPRPPQRRRKPTQFRQITIPEGIKNIIRKNQTILNENELEAFFNHVKKKACPSEVAKQYTTDLQGLKDQLVAIKNEFYRTPIIHAPEDKYFMKWFANVLERFDRRPAKRVKK